MENNIMVSICCIAYNHEKYISKSIESFLNQKTDFQYEIIIHDDASTDSTPSIIAKYSLDHPNIIKAIYQKKNQYSQNKDILKEFMVPYISGKYVAICEGDDFWNNENKLQQQVDIMEANPLKNMCVHATREVFEDEVPTGITYPNVEIATGSITSEKLFSLPYSFHTSSYLFRANVWKKYISDPPLFRTICDVGDEPDLLYFGKNDGLIYINEIMSSYRRGVPGSWSSMQSKNIKTDKMKIHAEKMIRTYLEYDAFTNRNYHNFMARKISISMLQAYTLENTCYKLIKKENREYFLMLSLSRKLFVIMAAIFPSFMQSWYIKRIRKLYKKNGY